MKISLALQSVVVIKCGHGKDTENKNLPAVRRELECQGGKPGAVSALQAGRLEAQVREEGYVVYLRIAATKRYDIYTSPKRPVDLGMAKAYSEHLRRNKTDSMIVALPSGEIVQEVLA